MFLLQNNRAFHTAQVAVSEPASHNSQGSSPIDVLKLKSHFCSRHFENYDVVLNLVEEFLEDKNTTIIDLKAGYIEK